MITIYKYPIPIADEIGCPMPKGAKIVHCAINAQHTAADVWAIIDTDAPIEVRTLYVRGTGYPLPEYANYIMTFFDPPFVWHLFEG